jgi:nifR3 family TIM-barrel protein
MEERFPLPLEILPKLEIGQLKLSNPLLLAPMAGISNLPFRLLAREYGCALAFTEMVSAEGLIRQPQKSEKFLRTCPEDKPWGVQIFGSRPEVMATATKILAEKGADILNINMGCPVRKITQGGAGSALLKDLALAKKILRAVRQAISIPLTVKIRLGWDEQNKNYLQVAKMVEEEGVDGLVIHGRTRAQGYNVKADWGAIAEAQTIIKIPVIGNGDLLTPQAVIRFFKETKCAGAMIGRGALGNPWIFQKTLALDKGEDAPDPSLTERESTIERHLHMLLDWRGEVHGVKEFRKHLIWYTKGLPENSSFRGELAKWQTKAEVLAGVHAYFKKINSLVMPY